MESEREKGDPMMWAPRDRRALQDFALTNAWNVPEPLQSRAFRTFPGGWAVALSVNR
jgi:hypothetical protein